MAIVDIPEVIRILQEDPEVVRRRGEFAAILGVSTAVIAPIESLYMVGTKGFGDYLIVVLNSWVRSNGNGNGATMEGIIHALDKKMGLRMSAEQLRNISANVSVDSSTVGSPNPQDHDRSIQKRVITDFDQPDSLHPLTVVRQSEVDKTRQVTMDQAVVSLVLYTNSNHIFLIGEAYEKGMPSIVFADLVSSKYNMIPNREPGKIRIEEFIGENQMTKLKYKCRTPLMKFEKGQKAFCLEMPIQNFRTLVENIKRGKSNPPIFCIFGKESFLTSSSAVSSRNERGHSCFTFAKWQVIDAYGKAESMIPKAPGDFILQIPGDSLFQERQFVTFVSGLVLFCALIYAWTCYAA